MNGYKKYNSVLSLLLSCAMILTFVSIGNGDEIFDSETNYEVGLAPTDIKTGDFNQDGILDLATSNRDSQSCSILIGVGDGDFLPPIEVSVSHDADGLTTDDFNNDGIIDIAVVGPNEVSVLIGDGTGNFSGGIVASGMQPARIVTADFNGDGFLDFATGGSSIVAVSMNSADGTFSDFDIYVTGSTIEAGDFDSDGDQDLISFNQATDELYLLAGVGDGTFVPIPIDTLDFDLDRLIVLDINSDGNLDLVASENVGVEVVIVVMLGIGDGTFSEQIISPLSDSIVSLEVGDFNCDGFVDVMTGGFFVDEIQLSIGNGTGSFSEFASYVPLIYSRPSAITSGDFDANEYLDFALTVRSDDNVSVVINQLEVNFVLGDINGDCLINLLDVDPFINLLTNNIFKSRADINQDGELNLLDVQPFVDLF